MAIKDYRPNNGTIGEDIWTQMDEDAFEAAKRKSYCERCRVILPESNKLRYCQDCRDEDVDRYFGLGLKLRNRGPYWPDTSGAGEILTVKLRSSRKTSNKSH